MANTTKDPRSKTTQQRGALASLTQQAAAELIGKPAYYLRDHAGEIPRNGDGSYDAREVVRWALGQLEPAHLPDELLEAVLITTDTYSARDEDYSSAFRALDDIVQQYGGAGYAAIGKIVVDMMKLTASNNRITDTSRETLEEIEAKLLQEARVESEKRFQRQEEWFNRREKTMVTECGCGNWRQGRTWHKTPLPANHVASRYKDDCPDCLRRCTPNG